MSRRRSWNITFLCRTGSCTRTDKRIKRRPVFNALVFTSTERCDNCLCVRWALWELWIIFLFGHVPPPPQSPDQTIPVLVLSGDACVVLWRSRTHSGFELRNAGWCFVYKLASALITDLDCSRIDFYHLLCTKSKCVGCKNVLVTSGMIVVGRCLHWALHLLTCCHDSCFFFFFCLLHFLVVRVAQ